MNAIKSLSTAILTLVVAIAAEARTTVKESLEQLKTNAENSEFNYRQYQDNLDVVNKNVEQSDKAIKELKKLKSQLISNTQNVDKNKKALVDMEKEILVLKQKEQAKLAQEEKHLETVRKILADLEANKKKREENALAYDKMTEQVKQEQQDWDKQVQEMTNLQAEIGKKEAAALTEKKNWEAKRKDYEAEAKKWERQASSSRGAYDKIKKLNE